MKSKIERLVAQFKEDITNVTTTDELEAVRVAYVGRKAGKLNEILKMLKDLSIEDKREIGPAANTARATIEKQLKRKEHELAGMEQGDVDLSLPGIAPINGHLHPIAQVSERMMQIFSSMGFQIYEGPELESDYYNFETLNFPPGHPARDIQDTFFIRDKITRKEKHDLDKTNWLMRTHTSNMQVRIMEENDPPLRCIIPGRTFRNEDIDASHEHTFYQLEGFVVDADISIGHLKWALNEIFRQLFGNEVKVRLRPGFFPFTEPSYEPEVSCVFCRQQGCPVCKKTGWIEIGGSGMIHPNVLKAAGYEEGTYTGFAFGMGLTRIAMLVYGVDDIRMFMQNDLHFLRQF